MKKYKGLGVVAFTITCMLDYRPAVPSMTPEQGQDTTEESATGDGGDEEDFDDEETDGIDEDNDGVIEDDEGETNAGDESDTVDSEESEDPVDDSVSIQIPVVAPGMHLEIWALSIPTDAPQFAWSIGHGYTEGQEGHPHHAIRDSKTVALRSSVRPVSNEPRRALHHVSSLNRCKRKCSL